MGNSWQETETSSLIELVYDYRKPRISISVKITMESINEVVTAPARTFKECLKIKSVGLAEKLFGKEQVWLPKKNVKFERERYHWFAPNVILDE